MKKYPVEIPVENVKLFFLLLSLSLEIASYVAQVYHIPVTKDDPELLDLLLYLLSSGIPGVSCHAEYPAKV